MKLLISEDDLTSRVLLRALTSKWGFEPVLVEDGEQAWKILQADDAPKLVLIDWELPGMSGPEVCQKVLALKMEDPPYIILLTGRRETDDIVTGLRAGANDFVSKPFNKAELQARLNVGKRVILLQQQISEARTELAEERQIIEETVLAMHQSSAYDPRHLRDVQAPVEKTSGDLLLSAYRPDGAQHVLLGDFTGHGLNAAIGGPLLSDTFYRMTTEGKDTLALHAEINRQLCEKMPVGLFLCAVLLEIDASRKKVTLLNCGMMDVLIFREGKEQSRHPSQNLPMGVSKTSSSQRTEIVVAKEDRLFAYSDGIVEVDNAEGEPYGVDRLSEAIAKTLQSDKPLENLWQEAMDYQARPEQIDDITLVEVSC